MSSKRLKQFLNNTIDVNITLYLVRNYIFGVHNQLNGFDNGSIGRLGMPRAIAMVVSEIEIVKV